MQAFIWILRFLIVLVLIWFAVKNTEPVKVNGLPNQVWEAPLVFVLLVVFVAGMVIGLLAWIPTIVRQRREITRMRKTAAQIAATPLPPGPDAPGSDIHGI
jgi:uncharacterized integral membrane protein